MSVLVALLLPARDRERFVRDVLGNMGDRQLWWQRVDELLSVAAAVPGLAVILRWARRRRARRTPRALIQAALRITAQLTVLSAVGSFTGGVYVVEGAFRSAAVS